MKSRLDKLRLSTRSLTFPGRWRQEAESSSELADTSVSRRTTSWTWTGSAGETPPERRADSGPGGGDGLRGLGPLRFAPGQVRGVGPCVTRSHLPLPLHLGAVRSSR